MAVVITHALLAVVMFAFFVQPVSAADVSISATVSGSTPPITPNPIVQFSGIAAPSAPITIKRGGTKIVDTTAATDASFSTTLNNQPTGQQIYEIAALDSAGDSLSPVTFAFDLQAGTTTVVSGVFLGPSIEVDKPSVKLGETVKLSGVTAPSSKVTISITATSTTSYTIQADTHGVWSKSVITSDIGAGTHTAKARAVTASNVISGFSATVTFSVSAADQFLSADLNTDGSVNIVDFSILLFYWEAVNPVNIRADINHDGRVDIIDFSILLFQWTG